MSTKTTICDCHICNAKLSINANTWYVATTMVSDGHDRNSKLITDSKTIIDNYAKSVAPKLVALTPFDSKHEATELFDYFEDFELVDHSKYSS